MATVDDGGQVQPSFPSVQVQMRRGSSARLRGDDEMLVIDDGNDMSAASGGGAPSLLQLWRAVARELGLAGYALATRWTAVLAWAKGRGPTEL